MLMAGVNYKDTSVSYDGVNWSILSTNFLYGAATCITTHSTRGVFTTVPLK
jgi:hypothetical protein